MAPRPFVPLTDGAQAQIFYAWASGFVSCRLWFVRRSGVVDITTLQALADGLFGRIAISLMPLLAQELVLASVVATDWTTVGGISAFAFPSSPAGGVVAPALSAMNAARVILIGAQPPRNFKNYNFLPGIPETVVNLNIIDRTWANDVANAYAPIIDDASVWGPFPAWRWVVTSQAEANSPRSEQFFKRVDFIRVAPTIRQRRYRVAAVYPP